MLTAVLVVLHVAFSLGVIALILLHRGSSGGLSDMFGGGAAQLRGSAVVEKNLDRLTVVAGVGFVVTTVVLTRMFG